MRVINGGPGDYYVSWPFFFGHMDMPAEQKVPLFEGPMHCFASDPSLWCNPTTCLWHVASAVTPYAQIEQFIPEGHQRPEGEWCPSFFLEGHHEPNKHTKRSPARRQGADLCTAGHQALEWPSSPQARAPGAIEPLTCKPATAGSCIDGLCAHL